MASSRVSSLPAFGLTRMAVLRSLWRDRNLAAGIRGSGEKQWPHKILKNALIQIARVRFRKARIAVYSAKPRKKLQTSIANAGIRAVRESSNELFWIGAC